MADDLHHVIPATPGYFAILGWTEDIDGEVVAGYFLEPVLAWLVIVRIDDDDRLGRLPRSYADPVLQSSCTAHALLYPSGRVSDGDSQWESLDDWDCDTRNHRRALHRA